MPLLLKNHTVHVFGRRPSGLKVAEAIAPAEDWPGKVSSVPIDVAISALGTTWAQAGSWSAFEAVDHDAVVGFARAAHGVGARQFITISSVGADPASRNLYLALRGRVERALAEIGFDRLDILRPGLLRGPRGKDRRRGERLGILLSPLTNLVLHGRFDRFAAIDAAAVAAAAANLVGESEKGVFVHHNREIRRLGLRAG